MFEPNYEFLQFKTQVQQTVIGLDGKLNQLNES